MSEEVKVAYVGLRSGGLLAVVKAPGKPIQVDASKVKLTDVAAGVATQIRFAGQMYRAYSVAEHQVLGSHLFENPSQALQFLFHDSAEGLGVTDIHWKIKQLFGAGIRKVEDAITEAVCQQFNIPYPFDPEIKEVDSAMGGYEVRVLHPARAAIFKAYGINPSTVGERLTKGQKGTIAAWFGRKEYTPAQAAELWLDRVREVRSMIGTVSQVGPVVQEFLDADGFFPHPADKTAGRIAASRRLPVRLVEKEITRLEQAGQIVRRKGFHHVA